MIVRFFLLILLLPLLGGCETDKGKDKVKKSSNILSLFKKRIDREYTDSVSIHQFLLKNPRFGPHAKKLYKFYKRRDYELAWSENGEFRPQAQMMVNLIHSSRYHGVTPIAADSLKHRFNAIYDSKKRHKPEAVELRKEMDLLLSSFYFEYAREIWRGQVDPNDEDLNWHIARKKIKYGKTLDAILASDREDSAFSYLEPLDPEYKRLKQSFEQHLKIQKSGGWPTIDFPETKTLKRGDTSSLVIAIKKRLQVTGEFTGPINSTYDAPLESAVKKFQARHGFNTTGQINHKTVKAMNISVTDRLKQIMANMERWRWIPERTEPNYIWVNIPEFKLHTIENHAEVWDMKVIVGRAASSTPVFNDQIEFVVFSPTWNIPVEIARDEIIPTAIKDSDFIVKNNITVTQNGKPVDINTIEWNTLSEDDYKKYSFRQEPGAGNALGKVKFLFPNEFEVYLHDTPTQKLFEREERDYSHGCIRLEDPYKFARYVLRNQPEWTDERIRKAMDSEKEQFVKLKEKIPVYIVYFTAWVDTQGVTHFREDLYKHDEKLIELLFEKALP